MDTDDVYLSAASQRRRYGNISAMTLWRWERDPRLNYPPPIEINGRKYRSLRALEEWERQRAAESVLSRTEDPIGMEIDHATPTAAQRTVRQPTNVSSRK